MEALAVGEGPTVQFVESSAFGVRAARLTFASRSSAARVTLFPMVHIGEPTVYRTTYEDALRHEVVLFEGVRSPIVARITRSYRWLVGSRAMAGLVVQPPIQKETTQARLVNADLLPEEFEAEWRAVSPWLRAALYGAAPVLGLHRRWFSKRRDLAKYMQCEDQPSFAELLAVSPETGGLTQAVLHARDNRLLERLRAELDSDPRRAKEIAVVYGAAHMRAVVRELTGARDFAVVAAEWRTLMADVS
jgi:hypothetical protein